MAKKKIVEEEPAAVQAPEVPTFTLRADRRFDVLAMVTVAALARAGGSPRAEEIEQTLRAFEMYEERCLR